MRRSAASSADGRLRLFFAALPDSAARAQIAAASLALSLGDRARRVPSDNYHMTLAFVGDVAATQVPVLREVGAAQKERAFSVVLDAYDHWPKSRVIVAAAGRVPAELQWLWQQLHHDLAARGWTLESERLRPHVTLARKVSQPPVLQAMSPCEWRVRDFCLMRSTTSGIQSAYTVVDTWSLLDSAAKA
ncbi:MAG TPA: RNA 2',3'-cyclic phosphodiesterase [Steroidobacteraceae bacterium]|nr:RNA 2',3'-cyclic phosphodiesterase [Steroidobacteraceae bacterium]